MRWLNIGQHNDSPVTGFTFEAINSTRFIGKTSVFSFSADENQDFFAMAVKKLHNNFGDPLIVTENGINIPYYVIRAIASTGKKVILVVCLHEGLMVMTKNNTELISEARDRFWDFLHDVSQN